MLNQSQENISELNTLSASILTYSFVKPRGIVRFSLLKIVINIEVNRN